MVGGALDSFHRGTMRLNWLAVLALLASSEAVAQRPDPLMVGVLRADGIAVPFATYAGGQWTRMPWDSVPDDVRRHEGPWYLVRARGPHRVLRRGSVVRFVGSDDWYEPWGVVTDFAPRRVSANSFPADRVGVVLSRPHEAVAFGEVGVDAPEARRLLALLRPEFARREAGQLARETRAGPTPDRSPTGHPRAAATRSRSPVRVAGVERTEARVNGRRLFLAVLHREYPAFQKENTVYRPSSVLSAWVAEDAGGRLRLLGATLQLDGGSGMQVSVPQPFAALRLGGRLYVLAEFGGYEMTERAVLQVGEADISSVLPPVS